MEEGLQAGTAFSLCRTPTIVCCVTRWWCAIRGAGGERAAAAEPRAAGGPSTIRACWTPGAGDLWELRPTDIDSAKCRRRYDVFKVTL